MPVVIAQVLRFVIIALVQSAAFTAVISLLEPLMDKAKASVKTTFGLSDDDAATYVANFVLDTAELAGLTVASLKTRFPLKVADKFGLTARGFQRGALPAKVSSGTAAPGSTAKAAVAAGPVTVDSLASAVASVKNTGFSSVQKVILTISAVVGGTTYTLSTIGNWIDFGNWNSGAYQGTFQKVFAKFGLEPDKPIPSASTVSSDVWNRVYSTYKELGAYAINDPYKQQSVIFSRQALIDLVDKIGAQLNIENGSAPAKAVIGIANAYVLIASAEANRSTAVVSSSSSSSSAVGTSTPSTRVFTGILSQGTLGTGLQFTARPDDLIESIQELQEAAANNLAAAVAALPARLSYEIRIVSSVITKDGFKQTGAVQKVQTGTYADGSPKYKTVTNKFAVLTIYLVREGGSRTKVQQITLGPTNVSKFNPSPQQVGGVVTNIQNTLVTSNTSDITSVVQNVPIAYDVPQETQPAAQDDYSVGKKIRGGPANTAGDIFYEYTYVGGGRWQVSDTYHGNQPGVFKTTAELESMGLLDGGNSSGTNTSGLYQLETSDTPDGTELIYYPPGTTPNADLRAPGAPAPSAVPPSATVNNSAGANATTLAEWYSARGLTLPSVSTRAYVYQGFGLGQAAYYTGTAEQNTKLLAALKAQARN